MPYGRRGKMNGRVLAESGQDKDNSNSDGSDNDRRSNHPDALEGKSEEPDGVQEDKEGSHKESDGIQERKENFEDSDGAQKDNESLEER